MEASRGVLCSVLVSVEGPASGSTRDRREGLRGVEDTKGLLHLVKRAIAPVRSTRGIFSNYSPKSILLKKLRLQLEEKRPMDFDFQPTRQFPGQVMKHALSSDLNARKLPYQCSYLPDIVRASLVRLRRLRKIHLPSSAPQV